jgi:hypothetical protein
VPRLILVLSDLLTARLSDAARDALPRLPQLEQWLGRAEIETTAEDWRAWLQQQAGDGPWRHVPPASIAAVAVPDAPGSTPVWLATPVHLVAGLDTVRVHPHGLLRLTEAEQRALQQDFSDVFAGSGWSLHATGRRELLLAGGAHLRPGEVFTHDPVLWRGADPRAGLPAGSAAAELRRLGAEIELWLHEHPVNQARESRGSLNANALWIWGGGAPMHPLGNDAPLKSTPPAVAWADELFLDGLAKLTGRTLEPLPPGWPPVTATCPTPQSDLWVVCEWASESGDRTLEALERAWIAPVLAQWRGGGWHSATLWAGGRAVRLDRGRVRNFWRGLRPTRPWWEALQKC